MNCLLDSHTLVWSIIYPHKLSQKARNIIQSGDNELFVSVLTYWELSIKYNLGKLEMKGISPVDLLNEARRMGAKSVELSEKEASEFYKFPMGTHKDPFDRMIVWQAIRRNLTLISKDKRLGFYRIYGLDLVW